MLWIDERGSEQLSLLGTQQSDAQRQQRKAHGRDGRTEPEDGARHRQDW